MAEVKEAAEGAGSIDPGAAEILAHPEEIKATVNLRIGDRALLSASARTTPAGLVAAGVMVSLILVSVAFLVRVAGNHRRRRYL